MHVHADEGRDGLLQVEGGQFFRGPMPEGVTGPAVESILVNTTEIRPGTVGKSCNGAVAPTTTGVALSLQGDVGYWVVPALAPDVQTPRLPSFRAPLGFASTLRAGSYELQVRAIDAEGQFGAPKVLSLLVQSGSVPTLPKGRVVIRLAWDSEADLDLHVIDPKGVELWKRNINTYEAPPPGTAVDPNAWKNGGYLDADSNAQCVLDGRRRETAIWENAAPPGRYLVRVDTFSLCAESAARWTVDAYVDGVLVAQSQGLSTDVATRWAHDRGAGVLAMEFDVAQGP
jgi:hypothetical protein